MLKKSFIQERKKEGGIFVSNHFPISMEDNLKSWKLLEMDNTSVFTLITLFASLVGF
jgi:hypothetical protein